MPTSEELQQELLPLRDLACQNWNVRAKRNRYLTKMIIKIKQSKKIFNKYPSKAALRDCYEEVQSKIFADLLCTKICSDYDPKKATIITWLNNYGKFRYLDCDRQNNAPLSLDNSKSGEEDGMTFKDLLAAEPENEYTKYYYELVRWIASDPIVIQKNKEKKLSEVTIKSQTEINAREVSLAVFEGTQKSKSKKEFNYKELERQFNVKSQTLRSFFQRTCLPLIELEAEKRGFEI